MRRVLMVTPHFPPDSSAAAHRVRLLAPHLPEAGWTPTIVTVDPAGYQGRLDRGLEALVPPSLSVVRARAWPARLTRRIGIGDLGVRAFAGLRRACRAEMARVHYSVLFITVYPVYPALLGPRLKAEFGVPFVLDYQDPWVGAWGLTVGGGKDGAADWKSRAARRRRRGRPDRRFAGHDRRHRRPHSRCVADSPRRRPPWFRAGRFHASHG